MSIVQLFTFPCDDSREPHTPGPVWIEFRGSKTPLRLESRGHRHLLSMPQVSGPQAWWIMSEKRVSSRTLTHLIAPLDAQTLLDLQLQAPAGWSRGGGGGHCQPPPAPLTDRRSSEVADDSVSILR